MALKQSVLIHAAKEGVRGAEAQQKEAFTGFLPKFSTSYSYTRLNEDPYFVFPGAPPLIPPGNMTTGTKDNYNWNVEARQPLFAGGGILANYEASRLAADIARMEEAATVQDLVQEVKISYFNILKASRILDVAKQSVEQLQGPSGYGPGLLRRRHYSPQRSALCRGRTGERPAVAAPGGKRPGDGQSEIQHDPQAGHQFPGGDRGYPETTTSGNAPRCLYCRGPGEPAGDPVFSAPSGAGAEHVKLSKSEYYPNVSLVGNYARYGDTPGVSGSPYKDLRKTGMSWRLRTGISGSGEKRNTVWMRASAGKTRRRTS